MIVVVKRGTDEEQLKELLREIEQRGLKGTALLAADKPVIHLTSGDTRRARSLLKLDRVQALVATSGPRVRRQGRRFFPYHFLNWSSAGLVLLGVLVLLAGQLPPGIGPEPNPQALPEQIALPWYLLWPGRALASLPGWIAASAIVVIAAVLIALPALHRQLVRKGETP